MMVFAGGMYSCTRQEKVNELMVLTLLGEVLQEVLLGRELAAQLVRHDRSLLAVRVTHLLHIGVHHFIRAIKTILSNRITGVLGFVV